MRKKRLAFAVSLMALIVALFVSCSADNTVPETKGEELAYVVFGNESSRGFTTEYNIKAYNQLYWYYSAKKDDQYGFSGVTDFKSVRTDGAMGLSTEKIGPFSQGSWIFTLYAYTSPKSSKPSDTDSTLVYQGSSSVTLKGGETKSIPVSVEIMGSTGTIAFKENNEAWFAWYNNNGSDGKPVITMSFVGTKPANSFIGTVTPKDKASDGKYYLEGDVSVTINGNSTSDIPADFYNVIVRAYIPGDESNSSYLPLASSAFNLRVYGNTKTYITGNIIESENNMGSVEFNVAKQEMAVFTGANSTFVSSTPSGDETKQTLVDFGANIDATDTSATHYLTVEVTDAASSNLKFQAVTSGNSASVAGISLELKKVTSDGITTQTDTMSRFTTPVTVNTYIQPNLNGDIEVWYNGEQPEKMTDVSYSPNDGKLTFKTTHFSEFYVVAKGSVRNTSTGKIYTSFEEAIAEAGPNHTVQLLENISLDGEWNINKGIKIDLNQKILNVNSFITLNTSSERYEVEFSNGTINASISNYGAGYSAITLNGDTSISLNNVDMTSNIVGIFAMNNQNNISIRLNDSSLTTNGYYALGTNAKQPNPSDNVTMIIKNSYVTVDRSSDTSFASPKDGDSTAICFNVKGSVIIEGSVIKADRQAVMLRGGEGHLIKDSTLETTGANNISSDYISSAWKSGNEVPLAALVIGNRTSSAYSYPTSVELDNVTLKAPEKNKAEKPYYGIYVYQCKQSDGDSYPVSVEGTISDESTNNIVNPIMSDNNISIAKFDVSGAEFTVKTKAEMEAALDSKAKNIIINIDAEDVTFDKSNFYKKFGGPSTESITINGNNKGVQIISNYRNHIVNDNNAKLIIKDINLSSNYKLEGSTWDDYAIIFDCPTEMVNVTFDRQVALCEPFNHTLRSVTINQTASTGDMYALWIEAGADVTISDSTIKSINPNTGSLNRAIKIADEYVTDPKLTKLNVSGTTFKSQKKAAVLVTSTAGADIVWGEGNDISNVVADKTNAVWNDADRTAAWDLVTVSGCTKYQEQ